MVVVVVVVVVFVCDSGETGWSAGGQLSSRSQRDL